MIRKLFATAIAFISLQGFQVGLFAQQEEPKEQLVQLVNDFESTKSANKLGGESGSWAIDPEDKNAFCRMDVVYLAGPENSKKCLKLSYSVDSDRMAMNGYWTKLRNFDSSKYDHLEFDIRGDEKAGYTKEVRIELKKFKDSSRMNKLTGMKTISGISSKWHRVSIPLTYFNGLYDKTQKAVWENPDVSLQNLDELVIVFHKRGVTKKKGVIYIDNIKFVKTGVKGPSVFDRPPMPAKDKASIIFDDPSYKKYLLLPVQDKPGAYDKALSNIKTLEEISAYLLKNPDQILLLDNGKVNYKMHVNNEGKLGFLNHDEYQKFLIHRLNGFPKKTLVHKNFSTDDNEMLREIAKDTWGLFDNVVDKEHGLPLDTIILGPEEARGDGCSIGDYTNVTNIGIYLASVVAAYDLGFITKEDAVGRLKVTLNSIKKLEKAKCGFLYNYYDTTWALKTDYFISLVDSGWLVAGLYVAKNAFPKEIGSRCQALIDLGNFNFFYDKVEQQMWHGLYDNMGDYVNYHYGIFYAEPRLTSFIAIGRGEVELEHWFRMVRTFPDQYNWTTQKPKNRVEKQYRGIKYKDGWYEYKDYKFVPSWGGSMFEALMPTLLIDEKNLAPKGLGLNDQNHVNIAINYTLDKLNYPIWGMSPSSNPEGGYSEYGVRPLGVMGYHDGAVTPHATFLALEFAPLEAVKNIKKLLSDYDMYGEYGFYDAVDPITKKVAYKYLSLDQGMTLIALDNYLNDGAIRKRFQNDPVFKKAKHLLTSEKFFED